MSRIGFSFWGICNEFETHRHVKLDTPDGHRYGRPIFVKELLRRGHDVYMMQQRREEFGTFGLGYSEGDKKVEYTVDKHEHFELNKFPDLDVLFLEWRFPTYKNDKLNVNHKPELYEPDLDRQREIIEFYRGKIPIIAWDTDFKITPDDEAQYPELILADPSFETNEQTRKRVSIPFWTDWKDLMPTVEPYAMYGYVGNNYERPDEFKKYYYGVAHDLRAYGIQTSMFGNWLQNSPDRPRPQALISTHQNVSFNHRMNFYDSMQMMNRFIATTHISKPLYYEKGFISPRYLEANVCGCPGLIPAAQKVNNVLGYQWIVKNGCDVINSVISLSKMTLEQRKEALLEQRLSLQAIKKFDVNNVISFIESCV